MWKIHDNLPGHSSWKHTFRLLKIYPSSGSKTDIKARLFNASLENPPPYDALSYRWETSACQQSIRINGVQVLVSGNLYSAMIQLRCQSAPAAGVFWIDQFCINQASIQDRNKQVQLMGLIYSKAKVVRIWTGIEAEGTAEAFKLVRDCDQLWSSRNVVDRVVKDETATKALTKLLHRSYWSRMWIFQEIVLAKQAIVHCGRQRAPWFCFSQFDKISADHELWLTAQISRPWILDLRKALFKIAHLCIDRGEARDMNNVLFPTRHLQCQDPRDKLYALRGVCNSLADKIAPDYSLPARDVYTIFAKRKLLEDGNLSLLLTAGLWDPSNGEDIQLPSWVPDLRGMGGVDLRYLAGNFLECFEADVTTNVSIVFEEKGDRSLLNVEAMPVDSVYKYRIIHGSMDNDEARRELIMDFCLGDDGIMLSLIKLRCYFHATIFEDSTFFGHGHYTDLHAKERLENLVLGFFEELHQLLGWQSVFTHFVESFREIGIDLTKDGGMEAIDPDRMCLCRMEYLCRAQETMKSQASTIYATLHGRIGIGTRSVGLGDEVAVVRGCRVPLLLRRYGPYYRLVGPSYVSGLMEKQGVSLAAEEGKENLEFEEVQIM